MPKFNINKSFSKLKNKKVQETSTSTVSKILNDSMNFNVVEAYKELRTNIIFSIPEEDCKVIAVTSASMSDGKSTTCLNLAISFAQTGTKVLIIDCDLRRPNLAKLLETKSDIGLSNALINIESLKNVVHKTKYSNLDAIFTGKLPPNPVELLASDNMQNVIQVLSKEYDYIFLDTPPVGVVTDATVLSKIVSGYVLVVRHGVTTKDLVLDSVKKFEFINAKVLGIVLNDVHAKESGYSKGKYKYSYRYKSYTKGYYKY